MFNLFKKKTKRSASVTSVSRSVTLSSLFGGYIDPMRASTVYACVKVLGEGVAMLPWRLYRYGVRRQDDGRKTAYPPRYEQWQHPLYKCLSVKPNPHMNAFQFKMFMMRSLVLTGDAYAYIVRDSQGRCAELWALDPRACVPFLHADHSVTYTVSFYGGGYLNDVPRQDIFHVCINPEDPFCLRGINPIEQQRKILNIDDNALEALLRQYSQGINTNLAINTPENVWLEDDKFNRLKEQINESFSGVKNTGKPLLLEGGLKATPLGMSNKDAQFLELYQFTQEQICKIFRVPPHMIGDLRRATFSNIEHQSLEFLNYTLSPYLTAFEQAVWSDLLTEEEQRSFYAMFDTTEFDRGDRASRFSAYATGIQNGILSPNECRAREDLPPRDGGDEYLTPLNMQSSGTNPSEEYKKQQEEKAKKEQEENEDKQNE